MDYRQFEGRVLELFFKTPDRVTAALAAYKIGIGVDDARTMLEQMATHDIVSMETDDNGGIYFDLPNRPPPTGEPLSWQAPRAAAPMQPMPQPMMQPMLPPAYRPVPVAPVPVAPVAMVPVPVFAPVPYVEPEKSLAASIALPFFFGPFGMFYSTVTGGVVMLTAGMVFVAVTLGFGALLVWPGCVVWSALAASSHNTRVRHQRNALAAHAHAQHVQHVQHVQYMQQMQQRSLPPQRK